MCEFEKLNPYVHVGSVCGSVALHFAEAVCLFRPPVCRRPVVEDTIDPPVKLIDVDCFEAMLQALLLGLKGRVRRLMLALFIGMVGAESLSNPIEHLAIEPKQAHHFTEAVLEDFLADARVPHIRLYSRCNDNRRSVAS